MKIITETPRLIIREFNLDDAQAVYDFNEPVEVNRYTGDAGMCTSLADARNIITDIWLKEYAEHGFARWAVVYKETNQVIGFCGFKQETRFDGVDIGYRLHPDYWGKGIATEANQACIDYAKAHMPLDEVFGDVIPENLGSVNVLKKLGLTYLTNYYEDGLKVDRYRISLNDI
ncbi:GNAT family N-acetyltransferase [Shewanella sp. WXL01]|uniref:N-acetyltransferase n=1 Tax=Shewanella maritima TaxID=2520507 RepID=A0A411PKR7_9GAMM|nr:MULTISPECIES: GNAT family N-acetyltransferase [Shewanella]NKF51821.1 GNAT family N-acetyltransferase [Shewanella sp. WXL01]QBF84120.1 N-acetyltransferase [Shewanella maritima]